jgi:hypothetical protein
MGKPRCGDCRHFTPSEDRYPNWEQDQNDGYGQGECRRHTPLAALPNEDDGLLPYGYWPVVLSGDFCSEFTAKMAGQ